MYPFYLGIDLHLKRTYVVLMDAKGEVMDERRIPNEEMTSYQPVEKVGLGTVNGKYQI